jgi:hypothetical protein
VPLESRLHVEVKGRKGTGRDGDTVEGKRWDGGAEMWERKGREEGRGKRGGLEKQRRGGGM